MKNLRFFEEVGSALVVLLVFLFTLINQASAQGIALTTNDGGAFLACSPDHKGFLIRIGSHQKGDPPQRNVWVPTSPEFEKLWQSYDLRENEECNLKSGEKVSITTESVGFDTPGSAVTVRVGKRKLYYGYVYTPQYHGATSRVSAIAFHRGKLLECPSGLDESFKPVPIVCKEQPQRLAGTLSAAEIERLAGDRRKAKLAKSLSKFCKSFNEGVWDISNIERVKEANKFPGPKDASGDLSSFHIDINNDSLDDVVYILENDNHYFWGSILVAFVDGDSGTNMFESEFRSLKFDPDELESLIARHPEWHAIYIGGGPTGSSDRYIFNQPYMMDGTIYIRTKDIMWFKVPSKTVRKLGKDGKLSNVCLYP